MVVLTHQFNFKEDKSAVVKIFKATVYVLASANENVR